MNDIKEVSAKTWMGIVVLSLSTFTIVTAELAPIGLLTPMAIGLQQSEALIGLTVTMYAWVGAFSALASSILLGSVSKKKMLLMLMLVMLVANVACALSPSYGWLIVARTIGALAHGGFWAMIGVVAVGMVPVSYIGVATSIVFGGVSAASVFGVPLANAIGLYLGWRLAFWLIALLSMVTLIGMAILIPDISSKNNIGVDVLKKVLKNKTLLKIYAVTLLAITAHFCAFTFIEPYLQNMATLEVYLIPILLLCFGVAGLLGNVLTGWLIDRYLKAILFVAIMLISLILLGLGLYATALTVPAVFVLIMLWGVSVSGLFVGLQTWVLRLAHKDAFPASALYVSVFNMAVGLGALLGAWLLAAYGLNVLMGAAGLIVIMALFIVLVTPEQSTLIEKA